MKNCVICKKELIGCQTKFCSRKCKNQSTNNKHQAYIKQQERGISRKIELIRLKGGCCEICGYKKNYAALSFHHIDPSQKLFALEIRKCSNSTWNSLIKEAEKCQLLCLNCHSEVHHPNFPLSSPPLKSAALTK